MSATTCLLLTALMSAPLPMEAPHAIRMSLGRMDVSETSLQIRIRFFWDDLQLAVMEHTSDMEFRLAETPEVDRTVTEYINQLLLIQADGVPIEGVFVSRGIDGAPRPDEVMWWYELRYDAGTSIDRVYLKNRLLFNMFEDQRNIVHVVTADGRERAYYFSWDEEDITVPVR